MKKRPIWAFVTSAGIGATIWALSAPVTGQSEPWDAEGAYYFAALAIGGALSATIIPRHLPAQYLGAVAGQATYELAFLKLGPLFVLGLAFLMGYSIIFIGAAAAVVAYRNRS